MKTASLLATGMGLAFGLGACGAESPELRSNQDVLVVEITDPHTETYPATYSSRFVPGRLTVKQCVDFVTEQDCEDFSFNIRSQAQYDELSAYKGQIVPFESLDVSA